jgi:cell division protein FtsW
MSAGFLPVPLRHWPAEARLLLGMLALWCLLGLLVLGSASWWVAAREMNNAS